MKNILIYFIIIISFTSCGNTQSDYMTLAKYNILCLEHNGGNSIYTVGKINKLLCNDGFIINNPNLDTVYGKEVYEEFIRLKNENEKSKI